ncbi:MAG: NAD-dependent dihydropyrimidine dehydrogenase subunit PreA, partial [Planctomycetes bacterium]|nr:NAD-dependent dihydropyrimidine dehydrogenase subunit PreA [Planctomycetota bacterium]
MSITGSKILETNFCGFKLANPFLVASGPSSRDLNMIKRAFESGWAGVVTKTISLTPTRDVSPRLHILNYGHSTVNIELISSVSPRVWIKWIKELKKNYPRRMLIASIMGSDRAVTWKKLGQLMAEAGADALELNISCPHGLPEKGMGSLVGQDPDRAAEVTDWVKRAVKIPVIVKLTPNVTDIGLIARACVRAGADVISGINTVKSLGGIDLKRLEPLPSVGGYSTFGGYGGAGVKPIALRCMAEIGQAVPLPLSGMGGILTWQDAAEFILVGCGTVQVCSGVMLFGYQLIDDLANGLEQY